MYDLILSVVTFNNPISMLDQLIRSARSSSLNIKIVFVDNSQNPEIESYCKIQQIDYLPNSNIGFGGGHNVAMREYAHLAPYFVVSNPDIVIQQTALEKLKAFMDQYSEVTISVPLVMNPDESVQHVHKRLPSPMIFFGRRFFPGFLKKLIQRKLDLYELQDQHFDRPIVVPSMSGCFMFIRSSIMKAIGGFDEGYFMYVEDIDITRVAGKLGPTVLYPDSKVTHLWTRGSYFNIKLMWINIKSIYYYFVKWGPDSTSEIKEFPCRYP
jgi:GT2 family glycosyltransferase